jgi:eukaryotic-like serine/threonine-protein kinase
MADEQIGEYTVTRNIGRGGFGKVVEAKAPDGKRVAIKILHANLVEDSRVVERFFREALILAKLEHPAIPRVYHFGPAGDSYYLVQEFVEGDDLGQVLARGPILMDEAIRHLDQLLDALHYAHERGIIHRDLKPRNIIITPDRQLKILDFGIAKIMGGINLTAPGTVAATLAYGSPEQLTGKPLDGRSDVFTAAVLLWEFLNCEPPFRSERTKPMDRIQDHLSWLQGEKAPLTALMGEVPEWLADWYQRATLQADERWASAAEARAALERDRTEMELPLLSMPEQTRPKTTAERVGLGSGPMTWVILTLVVITLLIAVFLAGKML